MLDADTLLLEYHLGEERSWLWAIAADQTHWYELPRRQEIESAALETHRRMLQSHHQTSELAAALAAEKLALLLFAPVRDLLADHRRLAIVAAGALQTVPFAALPNPLALPDERRPLVADHEIVLLPSAAVLLAQRQSLEPRRTPAPSRLLAVVADAVFDQKDARLAARVPASPAAAAAPFELRSDTASTLDLPELSRLEHSAREAQAILELAPPDQTFVATGFAASRQLLDAGRLRGYQIVHFATHGVLDTVHPELSAIVLSRFAPNGQPIDGYLRTYEVYNLDLPADLVVLSACKTALGEEVRGEGMTGLTRAFMYAGAARLLVSLWNIGDQATAELMQRFYDGLLRQGLGPAAALQQAQRELAQVSAWRAPYYWAGFVLQGDWEMKSAP